MCYAIYPIYSIADHISSLLVGFQHELECVSSVASSWRTFHPSSRVGITSFSHEALFE